MAETALLIAQISASLTSLAGIITVITLLIAVTKLSSGRFRSLVLGSVISVLIAIIGVSAMTMYHLTEETALTDLHETSENVWYIGMFIWLILSMIISWKFISFGKTISSK